MSPHGGFSSCPDPQQVPVSPAILSRSQSHTQEESSLMPQDRSLPSVTGTIGHRPEVGGTKAPFGNFSTEEFFILRMYKQGSLSYFYI